MLFNVSKCKVMHIGRNNPKSDYVMGGNKLDSTKEEKDLGVTVTDTLTGGPVCQGGQNSTGCFGPDQQSLSVP
jgi:ribonucleases P/MRP protein subunit RPP40